MLIEPTRNVTRFIGVASVGNADKQRWLYAFNIIPMTHCDEGEITKQPPDVTECPYSQENIAKQPKKVWYDFHFDVYCTDRSIFLSVCVK